MSQIVSVAIAERRFRARFQDELAPATCARFRSLIPWSQKLIHVRWSGEACWIPLGDLDLNLPYENATSHPQPGQFVIYPGGISETEVLVAYGPVRFASKAGQLAGNPFLIIEEGLEELAEAGRQTLWQGASPITFSFE